MAHCDRSPGCANSLPHLPPMPRLTKPSFRPRERRPARSASTVQTTRSSALWTGVRAALAVFLVSGFWILADWPHGSTAAILGAVATARLATMAPAVPIAIAGTLIFSLSTIPAFIIIDVLLPARARLRHVRPRGRADAVLVRVFDGARKDHVDRISLGTAVCFDRPVPEPHDLRPGGPHQHLDCRRHCHGNGLGAVGSRGAGRRRQRRAAGLSAPRATRSHGSRRRGRASASPSSRRR